MLPNLGMPELLIILALGVLLFGSRLPQVGRSLGRTFIEFKKGLRGFEDELEDATNRPSTPSRPSASDRIEAEAPKFDMPAEPVRSDRV